MAFCAEGEQRKDLPACEKSKKSSSRRRREAYWLKCAEEMMKAIMSRSNITREVK